jgi:hypothetical protein
MSSRTQPSNWPVGLSLQTSAVDRKEPVAQEDQESVAGADDQCVVACEGEGGFVITRPAHQPLTGGLAEG